MMELAAIIQQAFQQRQPLTVDTLSAELRAAVDQALAGLDKGTWRVAEKVGDQWVTHSWLKQVLLLAFRIYPAQVMAGVGSPCFDKIPLKFSGYDHSQFVGSGIRVVPPATVRYGAYIAPQCVLMPCYINSGAYVGTGSMIDTWATIGSCAQIGARVHISGGAGIGGVLEPLQANPTIIEDDCFIGARSEIVEGVVVEAGSVIAMGVMLGQSTPIYDRARDQVIYGRIPAGSVVVPGSLPGNNSRYSLNCAVIVKQVDAKTRSKTSINELLRGEVSLPR
ncbi:MAG: 2,3,4,5-tetrahydropyridine-2,6-dicarboxylate N-succinyltransferase [Candidatus Symbiodolus clandestinus]